MVHPAREIGEVALDFDVVLLWSRRDQEVVVVLDELEFMREHDGATGLSVFERA